VWRKTLPHPPSSATVNSAQPAIRFALALVERRRNVAATLAAPIADRRDPSHIRRTVADVLRNPLRHTEFATIRLRLLKVAGRVIESATRIRIALASCCPEAETFSLIALKLQPSGP
jgi:signal transduction histidine kinase